MQLVPPGERAPEIPCRHIPLTSQGETLDSLYATGTPQEIEETFAGWLRVMIQRLDTEQIKASQAAANKLSKFAGPPLPVAKTHEG